MMRKWIIAAVLAGMGACATAEPDPVAAVRVEALAEGEVSPPAKLDGIDWLVGHWIGSGLGGVSEEIIAPAAGGQMMGMFRQFTGEGEVRFYEFYQFAEVDGSLILRLKHFNPDFTGWEEKDDFSSFKLVRLEETAAYFDGFSFVQVSPGSMKAAVLVDSGRVIEFDYEKVD